MNTRPFNAQLIIGLTIIAIGVIFVLDNLNYIYAEDYFRYWPALIIIIGLAKLADRNANKFWASVFILGGTLLLLENVDVIDFRFGDWWPLILIALGGMILWRSIGQRTSSTVILHGSEGVNDDSLVSLTAVLGGIERKITSPDFKGGNVTTIMGGCELDLRQSVIKGDEAVLDIFALMGGVELRIPESWKVIIKGVPILGGFSDESKPPTDKDGKRLIVQGSVIMGGVEVKN